MKRLAAIFALLLATAGPAVGEKALFEERDCTKTETQSALNRCANENMDAANRALAETYHTVMAQQETEAAKHTLRELERHWAAFKDRKCAHDAGPRAEGGSMWPTNYAYCETEITKKRIRELTKMMDQPR
jgi:uncharacterized protein YecT (DUF1311 family)